MKSLLPEIKVDPKMIIPTGFPKIDDLLKGGLPMGALFLIAAKPRPTPDGILDLFNGKENVVMGPNEYNYLFGGKSLFTWNMIMKEPILLERFKKATHVIYDIEGFGDGFKEHLEKVINGLEGPTPQKC